MTSDADGNTLVGNGRTNAWDSQNRLVSCLINGNTTAYKYGADGLRRQSTKNGASTDYAYDATMLVREGHASGGTLTPATVTATYLIGARGPEYRRDDMQTEVDSQGRTVTKARWYVYDGLGSVVGEVDPLGNLTSSPKYDVYGAVRANPGTASSKQGFVGSLGHVSDDTGLIYMRARYYDANAGRFISEDPSANGKNWFVYADDNPANETDTTGKAATLTYSSLYALGTILAGAAVFLAYIGNKCKWTLSGEDGDGPAWVMMAGVMAVGLLSVFVLSEAFGVTGVEALENVGKASIVGLVATVLEGVRAAGSMAGSFASGCAAAAVGETAIYSLDLIANL